MNYTKGKLKVSFYKTISWIAIVGVLSYDFQVRFIYNGLLYLNDLIFIPFFLYLLFKYKQFKKWEVIVYLIIPIYLIFNIALNSYYGTSVLLRDLQFLIRVTFPFLIVSLAFRNEAYYIYTVFRKSVLGIVILGYITFILLLLNIDLLPYTSGRNWIGSRQLSSLFSEPALYGQMVIAYLFITYKNIEVVKENKLEILLIGFSLLLCQSAGAIFSLIVWGLYLSLKKKGIFTKVKVIIGVSSMISILIFAALSIPNSRIAQLLSDENVQAATLDRSGEIRVTNEFVTFQKFLKRDIIEKAFGLKKIDTNEFRVRNVDPLMGDIVGNGLIEMVIRYGFFYVVLLIGLFSLFLKPKKVPYFLIFLVLITQIDGAIGKPWTWTYIALMLFSLHKDK